MVTTNQRQQPSERLRNFAEKLHGALTRELEACETVAFTRHNEAIAEYKQDFVANFGRTPTEFELAYIVHRAKGMKHEKAIEVVNSQVTYYCHGCKQPIYDGEHYWCLSVQFEVMKGYAVSVADAMGIHAWCETCGNSLDFERASVPVKTAKTNESGQN